jgi:hypothetical protein
LTIGALTAGSKERRPLDVGHRRNVVHHRQFACASRGENRDHRRLADFLMPAAGGPLIPRPSSPCFAIFRERPAAQEQKMLVQPRILVVSEAITQSLL